MSKREQLNVLLKALAEGKEIATLTFPDSRPFKVQVIGVNLREIEWRSVDILCLDKDVTVEHTEMDYTPGWGGNEDGTLVTRTVPYVKDFVDIEYLSDFRTE